MGEFALTRVLNNDPETRTIFLLGRFRRDPTQNQVILILRKTDFKEEKMTSLFPVMKEGYRGNYREKGGAAPPEQYFHNNEYRKFWYDLPKEFSRVQSDVIYPAPERLIRKYTRQNYAVVRETAQIYNDVVKPHYIDPMNMDHCNWIYSVLNREKEIELRVHENESFLLNKDYKFNEGDIKTLYCLAIPTQRDLKSVRDLTGEHLPLLKAIRDESLDAIETKFNINRSKIMSYFHYQPTFYHLHVHFTHCENTSWDKRDCVRLDDAITNIEMLPDYYQRATLTYKVGTQMPLFDILVEKGILEP